jgi:hypothetical protein
MGYSDDPSLRDAGQAVHSLRLPATWRLINNPLSNDDE